MKMRRRNSNNQENQNATVVRRSPRNLQKIKNEPADDDSAVSSTRTPSSAKPGNSQTRKAGNGNSNKSLGKGGVSHHIIKTEEGVAELPKVQGTEAKPKKAGKVNRPSAFIKALDRFLEAARVEREAKSAGLQGSSTSKQPTVGSPLEGHLKREERAVEKRQKLLTQVKREPDQVEGDGQNDGLMSGWTKEDQEAVAKMVPVKSEKNCFDRIHAEQSTPTRFANYPKANECDGR